MLRYTTGRGAKARVMRSSDAAISSTKPFLLAALEEQPGVHALQGVGYHELGPQEADAVDGEGGDLLGVLGDGEVDVEPRGREPGGRRSDDSAAVAGAAGVTARLRSVWRGSLVDVALGPVDSHDLAVAQHRGGVLVPTTHGTPSSRETIAA